MAADDALANLLLRCEQDDLTSGGYEPVASFSAEGRDVFVVSDLHLAEGIAADGRYAGTENFFVDAAFARFLHHVKSRMAQGRPSLLIINGDFVDFMRIRHVPREGDLADWSQLLIRLGMPRPIDVLRASISKKEVQHGLKTHDYKSVWKLARCIEGHSAFFDALADWVAAGHHLVIVRGNHDLEWYWLAVRNYVRLVLAERIASSMASSVEDALQQVVFPSLRFVQEAAVIDNTLYVEHGHRYDKFTAVLGDPVLKNGEELNIPFGSFFNRYLINHVELVYPYFDNLRPRENLLPVLIRERFFLALRLMFQHVPFALKIIPKRYYRYLFGQVLVLALAVGLPVGIMLYQVVDILAPLFTAASPPSDGSPVGSFLQEQGGRLLTSTIWLIASYFLSRLVAYLQLKSPDSLARFARKQFETHPTYRFITFGHTHTADQFENAGRWFYNTGTWVPVIEVPTAAVRLDKTYTFLHLRRDASGRLVPGVVRRWHDASGQTEPLILIKHKQQD